MADRQQQQVGVERVATVQHESTERNRQRRLQWIGFESGPQQCLVV